MVNDTGNGEEQEGQRDNQWTCYGHL